MPSDLCLDATSQSIGAYPGFQASLNSPQEKNQAHYYITHAQPPNKTVVNEMMRRASEAAEHKNMPFIQLVGDQPVYALMLELKHENPEKYKEIIPIMGAFHGQNAFMATIYKRFKGSGIFELVHASDLLEEGSTDQALRGAHHNRGMRCYMLLYEALVRLLTDTSEVELPKILEDAKLIITDINGESKEYRKLALDLLLNDPEFSSFIMKVIDDVKSVHSDMANYWLSFLEMVEILLMHYHAMRTQNWKEYLLSIRLMLPWMAIHDSLNYTRYMSIYWVQMNNLSEDVKFYMEKGLFSASMTGLPFSAIPYDQWIEMTMNKGSKMKGGWIGFTKNESIVNIHTHTVNSMMQIRETLHSRASLKSVKREHAANTKSRLKTDEQKVQNIIACLVEWDANPWDKDKKTLRSLESGFLASKELIADFSSAKKDGEIQIEKYFEERIKSSESHLINDRYDVDLSIKKCEQHKRSALYASGSRNIFPKANQVIPSASTFNGFFGNPGNKIRLQKFLRVEFQRLVDENIDIYYTLDQHCYHLNSDKSCIEYTCHHHEADTRIFYHAEMLTKSGNDIVLTVDSADTDVIIISAYFAHTTDVPVFLYKKGILCNCKQLCSPEEAKIIIPFHAFMGADAVSGFFGHSKVTTWKRLSGNMLLLSKLGRKIQVTEDVKKDLERFTIRVVYNDKNSKTLNEARSTKWRQMKKKGTLRLPPDYDSFEQHLKRSNYVAYIWFNFGNPGAPNSPLSHGFVIGDNNAVPLMHTKPALPTNLEDLVKPSGMNEADETSDSEHVEDTDDDGCESEID